MHGDSKRSPHVVDFKPVAVVDCDYERGTGLCGDGRQEAPLDFDDEYVILLLLDREGIVEGDCVAAEPNRAGHVGTCVGRTRAHDRYLVCYADLLGHDNDDRASDGDIARNSVADRELRFCVS